MENKFIVAKEGKVGKMRIFSEIDNGGFTLDRFLQEFDSLQSDDSIDEIEIQINSLGGSTWRGFPIALLPQLNSPLYLNADGTLRIETVGLFTSKCEQGLDSMRRDGELSNYLITIDANQDVLSDDTLTIGVALLPVGISRFIKITLGYAVSIA